LSFIVIDVETVYTEAHKTAVLAEPCPEFKAPSNYKDEAKIAESIAKQKGEWEAGREQRIAQGALDPRTGRILCFGAQSIGPLGTHGVTNPAKDEAREVELLREFWQLIAENTGTVVTFNGTFDLRFLLLRSIIQNVKPSLAPHAIASWFRRYSTLSHFDCRAVLNNWDSREAGTLGDWCKAFGIKHDDSVKGSDIYALYVKGDFNAITTHCRSDVGATVQLYSRIAPFYV